MYSSFINATFSWAGTGIRHTYKRVCKSGCTLVSSIVVWLCVTSCICNLFILPRMYVYPDINIELLHVSKLYLVLINLCPSALGIITVTESRMHTHLPKYACLLSLSLSLPPSLALRSKWCLCLQKYLTPT